MTKTLLTALLFAFIPLIFVNTTPLIAQTNFYLHENGVTILCPDAEIGETGEVNDITYTKRTREQITTDNASTTCTSGIKNMDALFAYPFNRDISSWDVSNVTFMNSMFFNNNEFNGDLSSWDVSNVTDMRSMFELAKTFNGDLSSWNVSNVTYMRGMFSEATSFNKNIGNWDVSSVLIMRSMFHLAGSFNQDLGNWDVSNVTDMSWMFRGAYFFNGDLSDWDVSNVTNMSQMFFFANSFNCDLSDWDVSNVTDMSWMFYRANAFNGDLSNWDVSNVTNMRWMFYRARAFNSDLNGWDVSKVTNMSSMFSNASSFNQDIGNWDVSNVTYMNQMFMDAVVFNQDIGGWDITNVTIMVSMLDSTAISPINYDNILTGWSEQHLQNDIFLGAIGLFYCEAGDARQKIIDQFNWRIEYEGISDSCESVDPVVLLSPENGAENIDVSPTLSWEETDNSVTYHVQLSLTEDFEQIDLIADTSGIEGTEFMITEDLESTTEYFWRVNASNDGGTGDWSNIWSFVTTTETSVIQAETPIEISLNQNYPNPFNPTTQIRYGLTETSEVQLSVYNMLGQRVAMLENGTRSAGWHEVSFDASALSSGIFIYRLQTGDFVQTRKMMLVK